MVHIAQFELRTRSINSIGAIRPARPVPGTQNLLTSAPLDVVMSGEHCGSIQIQPSSARHQGADEAQDFSIDDNFDCWCDADAHAKDKPLPKGLAIICETDAKACKFVDLVSGSDNFMFKKADDAARNALIRALDNAMAKGANSAVLSGTPFASKATTVMVSIQVTDGAKAYFSGERRYKAITPNR